MSRLEEIRAVLQKQSHAIVTEAHSTEFPFFEIPESFPKRTWTHAVTFTIIPKSEIEDRGQLQLFMNEIVKPCGIPFMAASFRAFSDLGYGRAMEREMIGTLTDRRNRIIEIEDAAVPLRKEFEGATWDYKPPAKKQDLFREITLSFCPHSWLHMMAYDVERRYAKWMHRPTSEQLVQLAASRRR
jgi:hypothetical protein